MTSDATEPLISLNQPDEEELLRLLQSLELSEGAATIFAIAPEPSPTHPVIQQFQQALQTLTELFRVETFRYSDRAFYEFLYSSEKDETASTITGRRLVMIYGLDQLPTDRLVREMDQLNRGRETIAKRNLVLIFWLNKADFLDEFRSRAPDFWDWRGKVLTFQTSPPVNPLLYPYLEWLIAENSYLKMSGIMQVNRQVDLFLDQIYVSLQAERQQKIKETPIENQREFLGRSQSGRKFRNLDPISDELSELTYQSSELGSDEFVPRSTNSVIEKIDLSAAIRNRQFCVILGAPGAGKTTLLRYLALHFAKAKRDRQEIVKGGIAQENLGESLLPIFFRIADYAEQLEQQPKLRLLDYLYQFYRHWETYLPQQVDAGAADLPQLFLTQLCQGNCLVLMDGLDEVFDQQSRRQIVAQIEVFTDEFRNNKFVVTSRIAGYQEVKLSDRFTAFTITDMNEEQVSYFLKRWCQAIERAQQPEASDEQWQRAGDQEARLILEAIQSNEGVKRLTTNPLLLTILALIHRNGTRLPHRRVDLYALAVKTLTEDWQLAKKLPQSSKVLLKETELVPLLAPLAYWMHQEKPSGLATQEEVEQQLAAKLGELNNADPKSEIVRQTVAQFLRRVRETTGLFVERAPGAYGFMHLTFEEYFVARFIADHQSKDILKIIQQNLQDPRWNEPILLALGFINSNSYEQSQKLIRHIFHDLICFSDAFYAKKNSRVLNTIAKISIKQRSKIFRLKSRKSRTPLWILNEFFQTTILFLEEAISLLWNLDIVAIFFKTIFLDYSTLLRKSELAFQILSEIDLRNYLRLSLTRSLVLFECFTELFDSPSSGENEGSISKKIIKYLQWLTKKTEKSKNLNFLLILLNKVENSLQDLTRSNSSVEEKIDKLEKINSNLHASEFLKEIARNLSMALQDSAERLFLYAVFGKSFPTLGTLGIESVDELYQSLPIESKASAYYQIGDIYQNQNKYNESIFYHKKSLDFYKALGQEVNVASQWSNLSTCFRESGKYEQAIEAGYQYLAIRQGLNDRLNIAFAYYQLGRIYQAWSKYEEAIIHYEQSRDRYQNLGKSKSVRNQWYWLGSCYKQWGKYGQALECQQKSLEKCQELRDQHSLALAYYRLGSIYQAWGKYEEAIAHYEQSRDRHQQLEKETNVANQWYILAGCYREWGKYELALNAEQQDLAILQKLDDQSRIANAYFQLGRIYQAWGKYEEAIAHYEQSRDRYQHLKKETNVANQWYWMASCYREWGKYELAIEAEQQDLAIRQKLDDQPGIADAYFQLGRIHQAWGKYEQAIAHYQQSRDRYQQLEKEKDVADLCYWMADCYREWGKYALALDAEQQDLAIRQKLDDQSRIAIAYYQLGRIHQAWGKYEEAIAHYQQSRDRYQQLEKEKDVADLCYWMADCYREWGKYALALDAEQQDLAIRQKLDDQSRIAIAYYQLGRIHQAWGKYEEAIAHYQQSRDRYQQLDKESDVANQWDWMASCYRERGKYVLALESEQQNLGIRQKLDDQPGIANAYFQLGCIYQVWGKYKEAIAHYQQSRDRYETLDLRRDVANLLPRLASCYRESKDCATAIEFSQKSVELYQTLGLAESAAKRLRQLSNTLRQQAKDLCSEAATTILQQASVHLQQAIDLDTAGDYRENLAYDQISLALLAAEYLRHLPAGDASFSDHITQFEQSYATGFAEFSALGQAVDSAEEALDIARAYLEINVLEDLDRAETLAHQSLQTFQDFNRLKLQAAANKLLGEIYLKRASRNQNEATATAQQFLLASVQHYRELDLTQKAEEVEQLLRTIQHDLSSLE